MVGIGGVVGLPVLLGLVLAAAWADEPFFFFVSDWYRTIRVVAPHYFDAWKTETRQEIAHASCRLTALARSKLVRHLSPRGSAIPHTLRV